ncbi:hypothetical protein [Pseudactinotalea sp. Z1748]|uniref:hypothetical protein n=1 Tax=Pseudactinotalea sp. Z1748 TaxID=3413027 RepID=UPI003C7BDB0B
MVMHRQLSDSQIEAIQCGQVGAEDIDAQAWADAEREADDAAAGDLARKARKEGAA